jgi:hypothetical protein
MRGSWASISKNRLILVAITVITFCTVWIGYGLLESAKYEQQAKDKISEYTEYTRDKVTQACAGGDKLENIKCVTEAFEAKREYEYNQSDLVAQRQSALWAYIMAAAAVFGIALSAVGVFLVYTTFHETRKANQIATDTAKRQLRAYVFATGLTWQRVNSASQAQIEVFVLWRNAGTTPANMAVFGATCAKCAIEDDHATKMQMYIISEHPAHFGPGTEIRSPHVLIDQSDMGKVWRGEQQLVLYGRVDYRDAFGEQRYTCVAYRLNFLIAEGRPKTFDNVLELRWQVVGPHNGADGECD